MGVADVNGLVTSEVEVTAKPTRRRYTAEYKHRILREADAYTSSGEVRAILRRGGLFSSNLTIWRKQRERGGTAGLLHKKRGPLLREKNLLAAKAASLELENIRLRVRAERANTRQSQAWNGSEPNEN